MKPIINLALRSEYSFKKTFGHLNNLVDNYNNGTGYIGIADINNSFAHSYLEKYCKEKNIKPIFGVRLMVIDGALERERGKRGPEYIFIAKNAEGLFELNKLIKVAYEQFYYVPMLDLVDLEGISENIFIISANPFKYSVTDARLDYIALSPSTPWYMMSSVVPKVFINDNYYCTHADKETYQLFCGARKAGRGEYNYLFENKTVPQHILNSSEFMNIFPCEEAIDNTYVLAEQCNVVLPKAPMTRYPGKKSLDRMCMMGAVKRGIPLDEEPYADRYQREIDTIKEKDYTDYFLIVSDIVSKAKDSMLVGPGRGSSAGSLVCYLLGITDVDPIEHGLIFERFIDINRPDLPDIDIDFPDQHRGKVIKNIIKTYGKDNVAHLSNVNVLKPKSAINEFGIALRIPSYEIDALKDSIVDRSGGDARAAVTLDDTLDTTEVGKEFIEKYPAMILTKKISNHASHAGKHAAGVIICNEDMCKFGGINAREESIMLDKRQAEYLNLLKIDCLGLRTLSILQDCADQIGMKYDEFPTLPLDDEKTFQIFNDMRLSGIFQFEGQAMNSLCKGMGVHNFNDVVAITALARPGPLHSGGAAQFIKRRIGEDPIEYASNHPEYVGVTEDTYGIIVYQEQLMSIARKVGNMSWKEVSAIRKAASKTMGKEFFDGYRQSFLKGTTENGIPEEEAINIWESMMTFGSWGMNKSHTVSYGYISYWCAYMKAHYPLQFYAATLRNSKGGEQTIQILRDAKENEGIEYVPLDPDESAIDWSIINGKLVGGLNGIKGIGEKKAKEVMLCREGKKKYTPSLMKHLMHPITEYDTLYPCYDLWHQKLFVDYKLYGLEEKPTTIINCEGEGNYLIVAQVKMRDLRDLNEYNEIMKRGGEIYKEDSLFLKLIVADDTDRIQCRIGRFDFERMNGRYLAETLKDDETWVLIKGRMNDNWKIVFIDQIYNLSTDPNEVFV